MGVIWTSRTRGVQPQWSARVDRDNPLTKELVFAAEASSGVRNIANNLAGEALGSGVAYGASPSGKTWTFSGSQGNRSLSFGASALLDGATSVTWDILVYFSSATPSAHFFGQWDFALKWLFQASGGYLIWVACDDNGGSRARFDSAGVVFPTAGWYRVIASWRGAAGTSLMVNRVITDRNASGPAYTMDTTTGNDYLQIGIVNGGTALNGEVAFARAWRRGLSEPEMYALHDRPWQLFEPERRPKFFSVGSGGNTYAVGISETATASETVSMLASFGTSISETATASETVATTAVLNASISETATASETVSMAASFVVTIGETATASETVAMALGAATFAIGISETATASETMSMLAAFGTSISETATASETVSMLATFLVSISETATASETVAMQLANQTYAVSISETATASDTVVMTIPTTYAISIIETVQAGDYVSMGVPSSDFWTQVTTTQSAGWGQINNTQSSGWTIIPTT